MNNEELKELLHDAQEHMQNAIDLIQEYVLQTVDTHTDVYLLDPLKIMTTANHGFLTKDPNIEDLINKLNSNKEEE